LPRPLRGIIPPIVTPLTDQDQLDLAGMERLLERLIRGGVHGIFALGTTGEAPYLTHGLRHQVVEFVCDQVAGRVPVLVGITDTSFTEALELADHAFAAGASGVVTAPPNYLPLSQSELSDYVRLLAERLRLHLLLYNMPGCVRTSFDLETVRELSGVERVVGLKDSSGDLHYLRAAIAAVRARPDFSVLIGPEEMLADALAAGAHGGVSGGANMFPELYVSLYEAAVAGRQGEVDRCRDLVLRVARTVYSLDDAPSRVVKGIKRVLKLRGVCEDFVAQPFRQFAQPLPELAQFVHEMSDRFGEPAGVPGTG
jgi:4-hydroxy-tetrahydrodipicolinate synthase